MYIFALEHVKIFQFSNAVSHVFSTVGNENGQSAASEMFTKYFSSSFLTPFEYAELYIENIYNIHASKVHNTMVYYPHIYFYLISHYNISLFHIQTLPHTNSYSLVHPFYPLLTFTSPHKSNVPSLLHTLPHFVRPLLFSCISHNFHVHTLRCMWCVILYNGWMCISVCVRMCVTAPIRATPAPHFFFILHKTGAFMPLLKCSLHLVHSGG